MTGNYSVASPVAEMIGRSGLSARAFERRFKRATGLTPIAYVQQVRIDRAKRMLERGDLPVDRISWEVGYEDGNAKRSDIRKHRNDVFRLLQLLPTDQPIEATEPLKADLRAYVERVNGLADFDPNAFGVPIDRETGLGLISSLYQL